LYASQQVYKELINYHNQTPQQARSVLPHSLKTEIIITGNMREWRHFLKLRCDGSSHPQIREIALLTLKDISDKVPVLFDDLKIKFLS
jgi:thymidylate synthase (FAD)